MKLRGIEFHGFKSFADSSEIRFHEGITAIVGPNGCGKSNISDALRWVLGEQRPSAIRGSRMEEAIFQGTERRKPIHRAEVTLDLDNHDGLLPVPYSEVKISRTLHRGGEGEYRLNESLCRLRDIQDLCRDTGLGTNAYAIIEARMIDAILSDRAEERRAMFEEAAGIGRYKERRRVAMRRLDEADGDVARIDDLIAEVEKKVRSLARQRGRARRYFEFRERKLALELALAQAEIDRLQGRKRAIDEELELLEEARVSESVEQRSGESEHERVRAELADVERGRSECARKLVKVRDRLSDRERARLLAEERKRQAESRLEQIRVEREELSERAERLGGEIDRLRKEMAEKKSDLGSQREILREREAELAESAKLREALEKEAATAQEEARSQRERRAELEARLERARADAEELERRRQETEVSLGRIREGLEEASGLRDASQRESSRAEERLNSLIATLERDRAQLAEWQSRREDLRARQATLTERRKALEARIESLAALTEGGEGLGPAVREALKRADDLGIEAVLGRGIQVDADFAEGLEAYLGPYLEAVVVPDADVARRVRDWFLERYDGPGGLVVLRRDRVPTAAMEELPPGVVCQGPASGWIRYLLREARFDDSSPLTDEGGAWIGRRESVDRLGVLRLGQPHEGAGLLARRAKLQELRERGRDLQEEAARVLAELREVDDQVTEHQDELARREVERRAAEQQLSRSRARAEAADERVSRLQREAEYIEEMIERLTAEHQSALERARAAESGLKELEPVERPAQAPDLNEVSQARAEWERRREIVADLRLAEARAAAALERTERELQAKEATSHSIDERLERLGEETETLGERIAESGGEAEQAAADLEALFRERGELETEAAELEERSQRLQNRAAELETQLRQVQKREREHSERRHELELERSEIRAELRRARERLEDEWGKPFDTLRQETEAAVGDRDELANELSQVAERLVRLEPVNMLAEQEYQEESERLEFLQEQREDLARARDDLRDTIRRINATASRELIETLEKIRENFRRTFLTLFQGGECNVWLEDPDDPLDSAIEISASPSGKRTQRIHLLSGGERALTALALLFAIYLVKPSPFCVLDEVDAPLDETNIRRFVAMLEEFKSDVQFIIITHNPVTIESADWIYGVTMEEPGVSKIVGVEFSEYSRGAVA